jgi:hypothetical protein
MTDTLTMPAGLMPLGRSDEGEWAWRAAWAARLPVELLRHLHDPGSPMAADCYELGFVRGWTAGAALGDKTAATGLVADEWADADINPDRPCPRGPEAGRECAGWWDGFAGATARRGDAAECAACGRRLLTDIDGCVRCLCTGEYGCCWHDDVCRCGQLTPGAPEPACCDCEACR